MTAKAIVCPQCRGTGTIPVGPEHFVIIDFLSKRPKEWFRQGDLPGEKAGSRVSALVVAGIVQVDENPHQGNKYQIDQLWFIAHQKPVDPQ